MTSEHILEISVITVLKRGAVMVLISLITLISMGALTSCQNNNQENQSSKDNPQDAEAVAVMTNQSGNSANNNTSTATDNVTAIEDGKSVYYDVNSWDAGEERYKLDELKKIQKTLGTVTSTDKNSLDFANNPAIKYRFMNGDEPYLDIIDSQNYFELGWYYANPNDSQEQKQSSIKHAEKAYKLASHLMGDAGGDLVRRMLTNQIIKNESVDEQHIQLAKCEFYSCMLIIKKQDS